MYEVLGLGRGEIVSVRWRHGCKHSVYKVEAGSFAVCVHVGIEPEERGEREKETEMEVCLSLLHCIIEYYGIGQETEKGGVRLGLAYYMQEKIGKEQRYRTFNGVELQLLRVKEFYTFYSLELLFRAIVALYRQEGERREKSPLQSRFASCPERKDVYRSPVLFGIGVYYQGFIGMFGDIQYHRIALFQHMVACFLTNRGLLFSRVPKTTAKIILWRGKDKPQRFYHVFIAPHSSTFYEVFSAGKPQRPS